MSALQRTGIADEIGAFIDHIDKLLGNAREAERYSNQWEKDQVSGKEQPLLSDGYCRQHKCDRHANLAIAEEYQGKMIDLAEQVPMIGKALAAELSDRFPNAAKLVLFLVNCFPKVNIDVDSSEQLPWNTNPDWLPIKSELQFVASKVQAENPYRAICDFALRVHQEEGAQFDEQKGRPLGPEAWGPRFREREAKLKELVNAGLVAADRTGFPVQEVERRLKALADVVIALLLWQRDAPRFTAEELAEERERYAGVVAWQPKTGPYLLEHKNKIVTLWPDVDTLAIRLEAAAPSAQLIAALPNLCLHIDDIDTFQEVRGLAPGAADSLLDGQGYFDRSEDEVQTGLEAIIGELFHKKDWGGETNDLYTTNIKLNGVRIRAAFLLKGNGLKNKVMKIANCGKNGDQIVRLLDSPAELFVVQFVGNIDENLIRDLEGKVELARSKGKRAWYCVMNGQDTARLLMPYGKV